MSDSNINIKVPTEKCLEEMVFEEEKIRNSKEYQDECTKVKDIPNGWLDVSANVQKNIVKKFGFDDDISCEIACNMLRRARYIYPNNNIFKTIPVYVRENKASEGNLKENDYYINVNLHNLQGKDINLSSLLIPNKLNIIISSSLT